MKIAALHDEVCEALYSAGGSAPEGLLPAGYIGKKADAVFADERVIVEVKSLCKDRTQTEAVTKRIDRIFDDWSRKGGPIVFGQVRVDVTTLPPTMAKEIVLCFGDRIKTDLKDASRQIRETCSALGWADCYGVTIFAVPTSFRTHPGVIGHAAWDLLRRPDQAPFVHEILIFAVPVKDPLPHPAGDLMISAHPRGPQGLRQGFVERVCDAFAKRFAKSFGVPQMRRINQTQDDFMSLFMGPKLG